MPQPTVPPRTGAAVDEMCECSGTCTNCRRLRLRARAEECSDPLFSWDLIEAIGATMEAHGYEPMMDWPGGKEMALVEFLDELIHSGEPIEDSTSRQWAEAMEWQGRRHAIRIPVRHRPAPARPATTGEAAR